MNTNEGIVQKVAQKLLDYHLGKGPKPEWNDLFQGFTAAHDLLAHSGGLRTERGA